MSEIHAVIASLARIENKVDDLRTAVADLANRVTALETSEKHRSNDIDRRFGEVEKRIAEAASAAGVVDRKLDNAVTKLDRTVDEVVEARGGLKTVRWMLIGALGLGGGGAAISLADGATAPSVSPEATIAVLEAAASAVP